MPNRIKLIVVVILLVIGGCARLPSPGLTPLRPANMAELQGYLLKHKADMEQFRDRGPFAVEVRKNVAFSLPASEPVKADLYLSAHASKAALVIILHGYENGKEDHAYQALHVATWGMHTLALQLPNKGPWDENAKLLAQIVEGIYRQPGNLDKRIDAGRIILAGHSFGAAAVAIALAEGAAATSGILLDPASIDDNMPRHLGLIRKPVMLVGADERISQTRDREYFFQYIRGGVAEISIKDAAHEDAQYPAEFPFQLFGGDSASSEERQITFLSALTAAAFSFSATGKFDYAWDSFNAAVKNGRMLNPRKK